MERQEFILRVLQRLSILCLITLAGLSIYAEFLPERAMPEPFTLASEGKARAPDPKQGAMLEDIWKPAATPKGGVSWRVLESTGETTRKDKEGYIVSKPKFTPQVKRLEGKRIKVAGWMMPLENSAKQKHFVLLAYPPGCPFHFHAGPNQFIEVYADDPFPTNENKVHIVSGVLELTGQDESGIFYRFKNARPG